jgi:AcrR family transcriptional regulator
VNNSAGPLIVKTANNNYPGVVVKREADVKRVRRDPEVAKALILDAAERVFADHGPDAVGLKDVAKRAGVSHALVSHYFGSYDRLVEETLARRTTRFREAALADLAGTDASGPDVLIDRLADIAADRTTIRLAAWALLTGRARRSDFFSARTRGLAAFVEVLGARRVALGLDAPSKETLEFSVVATLTMVLGFGVAKEALLAGLGYPTAGPVAAKFEADYRARVRELIASYFALTSQSSGRR